MENNDAVTELLAKDNEIRMLTTLELAKAVINYENDLNEITDDEMMSVFSFLSKIPLQYQMIAFFKGNELYSNEDIIAYRTKGNKQLFFEHLLACLCDAVKYRVAELDDEIYNKMIQIMSVILKRNTDINQSLRYEMICIAFLDSPEQES